MNFISIYQSNLDEFFMVRVGSLIDQMLLPPTVKDNKSNMTPKEQLAAILNQVNVLNHRKDAAYEHLMAKLEAYGVRLVDLMTV